MKLIVAMIQPHKLTDVKQALFDAKVYKMTGGSVNKCVNRHQAAFSWVTGLTGTPLTYWAPW